MDFQINNNEIAYYVEHKKLAFINFSIQNNEMHISSTFVDETLQGQGLAKQMFKELVKFIRENHYKVTTSCWYIQKQFDMSDEYDDIKK